MQNPAVFDKCHELVKMLLDKDIIQGLRLDHIDGLYDPTVYLEGLRKLTGNETFIVVEKILEDGESFPQNWPVQGTTGYDFLAVVNNLFTQAESKKQFADFYRNFNTDKSSITQSILNKKSLILYEHMAGELENLYQLFYDLELADTIKIKPDQIKTVIAEFLIRCPVYRYYGNSFPLSQAEQKAIQYIFKGIREAKPELKETVALFEDIFFKNDPSSDYAQRALNLYLRCMQFTGPLMAKGVEDTLMYTYDRFIGHNEVGDTPLTFGLPVDEFHNYMVTRQQEWPLSINATATHDTKRGEGVRARLNVLTDIADDWLNMVTHWQKVNSKYKTNKVPDANDEYLIYQSIAGSYPMPGEDGDDFHTRMKEYLIKGLREAKLHTQWAEPNELYEASCKKFVDAIIQPESAFMKSFRQLQIKIADYGIVNSLAQTVLKFTCPGVPDVYQGCEFWDLSMVDPDNRRPVDYEARAYNLQELMASKTSIDLLWANRYNAGIKLWLTQLLFNERKNDTETFKNGIYIPLQVNGKYKDNVLAYARQNDNNWYIIAIPLHLGQINADSNHPGNIDWGNTQIILPEDAPIKWDNLLSGKSSTYIDHINVGFIFKAFPLALLKCT
jgi:(1->4)-alpha-D-glucan 1-alpha-D-glucosylmutase